MIFSFLALSFFSFPFSHFTFLQLFCRCRESQLERTELSSGSNGRKGPSTLCRGGSQGTGDRPTAAGQGAASPVFIVICPADAYFFLMRVLCNVADALVMMLLMLGAATIFFILHNSCFFLSYFYSVRFLIPACITI